MSNKIFTPARTLLAAAVCSTSFNASIALAYDLSATEASQDEALEIVITAGRQPQQLADTLATTEVITREDIERRQSADTVTLLQSINGLDLHRSGGRGSIPTLILRGADTAQTLILVDGIRLNSPSTGTPSLDAIPVESIERIEIVKGPMSSLYGADAMGGVIQIFTKKGEKEGVSGSIGMAAGSNAARRIHGNAQVGFKHGSFTVNLLDEQNDGIDVTESETQSGDLDPFKQQAGNFSSTVYIADNVKTQFNYLYSDSESDFDNGIGETTRNFQTDSLENSAANITAQLSDSLVIEANAGHLQEESLYPSSSSGFFVNTEQKIANTQVRFSPTQKFSWISGVDYSHEEVESTGGTENRENSGIYSQGTFTHKKFDFLLSGRADKNQAYGRSNTHSYGAGYRINEQIKLIANYGESFKAPTFSDLYNPWSGNSALLPEQAKSKELALRKNKGVHQWYITAYETQFDDLIENSADSGRLTNIASAEIEGAEIGYSTSTFQSTHLKISAAYTDARDTQTRNFLDARSNWTLFSEVYWQAGKLSWGVDFHGVHGKRDGANVLPSYGLIGAHTRYQIDPKLSLYADLDNLGDRDYASRLIWGTATPYQNPGRTILVGFDLSL